MLATATEDSEVRDSWVTETTTLPITVVSSTLEAPLDRPDATVAGGDAVDVVARLKEEADAPLRSHGSLRLNWAPVFGGAADFDLELLESRTLDGRTQELIYRPTLH